MDIPNIKNLKKLAETCRKAGISHFKFLKDGSFEFSLDPSHQPVATKREAKKQSVTTSDNSKFESDTLTDEQLLMWSVQNDIVSSEETPQ